MGLPISHQLAKLFPGTERKSNKTRETDRKRKKKKKEKKGTSFYFVFSFVLPLLLGGDLTVQSQVDRGTTVTFRGEFGVVPTQVKKNRN